MKLQAVAFDASTLILLAKTDLLRLTASGVEILISETVKAEALAKPDAYDAQFIRALLEDGKIRVFGEEGMRQAERAIQAQFRIGKGEASTLVFAKEKRHPIAVDDGPAIRAAKVLGIPFMTALHILIGLHERRFMETDIALAKLSLLEQFGRYGSGWIVDAKMRIEKRE